MREVDRIRVQMKQALSGPAWLGPSIDDILRDVDAATARRRPIPDAHTIWEIMLHLIETQHAILARLHGRPGILTEEEEWPPMPTASDATWRSTVDRFRELDQKIRDELNHFEDLRLDDPLVPGGSSAYNNLHGYVQHNLYHAGQIVMLKKGSG